MNSVVSIHALLLTYEAGCRALCTEPTCRNTVLRNVVDAAERGGVELMDESPTRSALTIGPMYHEYIHITIHKIHRNISDTGFNYVIKE